MSRRPSSPTAAERDRQQRALALRIEGRTLDQVATELAYANRSCALKAVRAVLDRRDTELANEYRALEDARLDGLWKGVCNANGVSGVVYQ